MEPDGLENVYQQARKLKNSQNYAGSVELYLLRYRTRTDEETHKTEIFPSFYSPLTEPEVQGALLDNFINSEATYTGADLSSYTFNGGEADSVSYLTVDAYSNIDYLVDLLMAKKDFQSDLRKLNVNALKCYVVRMELPENEYIYYFGGIKNYSQLQKKGIIVQKAINDSKLKNSIWITPLVLVWVCRLFCTMTLCMWQTLKVSRPSSGCPSTIKRNQRTSLTLLFRAIKSKKTP